MTPIVFYTSILKSYGFYCVCSDKVSNSRVSVWLFVYIHVFALQSDKLTHTLLFLIQAAIVLGYSEIIFPSHTQVFFAFEIWSEAQALPPTVPRHTRLLYYNWFTVNITHTSAHGHVGTHFSYCGKCMSLLHAAGCLILFTAEDDTGWKVLISSFFFCCNSSRSNFSRRWPQLSIF